MNESAVGPGGPVSPDGPAPAGARGLRRAVALTAVVFLAAIVQPAVLIGIPLLVLIGLAGIRSVTAFMVSVVAMAFVVLGPRDGLWFAERAWCLVAGGAFAAWSIAFPAWRLTSRALASIGSAVAACFAFLALRTDAWATLDWTVSDRLRAGFAAWLDALTVLRDGQVPSPALVSAIYQTFEAEAAVFPALLAIETMCALGVAWWLYLRLVAPGAQALGPVSRFGFNDHLVWLMIAGLVLVTGWASDGATRIGANLAVFMAALYAARGLAVGVFVSGGLSLFGSVMIVLGMLFAAPVVVGFAVLLGVADTWLDLRARVSALST